MPKRKKHERRELSDREILDGLRDWKSGAERPRPIRAHVWQWLNEDDEGFIKAVRGYDALRRAEREAVESILLTEGRFTIIRDARKAAEMSIEAHSNRFGPKDYTNQQFLIAFSLRLWMNLNYRQFCVHLNRSFAERIYIWGRLRQIPHPLTLRAFDLKLPPETLQIFLANLKPINSVLGQVIEERHVSGSEQESPIAN